MAKTHKKKTARQLLLEKKRRKKQLIINIFGYSVLFSIFGFVLFVFFTYMYFMDLKGIVVTGYHSPTILRKIVLNHIDNNSLVLNPRNFYLIKKHELEEVLKSKVKDIEDIKIEKKLKERIIKINIKEKKPEYMACGNDQTCYLIDKNAKAYKKVKNAKKITKIFFDKNINLDEEVLKKNLYDNLNHIKTKLQNSGFYIRYIKIKQNNILSDVYITSPNGKEFFIKLDLNQDPDLQLENLNIVWKELKNKEVEYIDLRFGNKIFYKLKNEQTNENEKERP